MFIEALSDDYVVEKGGGNMRRTLVIMVGILFYIVGTHLPFTDSTETNSRTYLSLVKVSTALGVTHSTPPATMR